ncbi:isochorismate synthase MenF [Pullulanibacillus camelliae]|uniref:isochorismate synthase n=1 Tax=Pullulanibacillus camelliae TaxID=1707096 RepID=A0A8J3DYD7_9BACL|nr:isochorismate synthase [Pullulanibacillus camelliae]GGE49980.1 isochorismate synthase MenF [Pullulanibacillus camelliae]
MINEVKQDSFSESFIMAVEKAKQERTEQLVSHTMQVEGISSIQFYANSCQIKTSYRHYWSDPKGLSLVGIGCARAFEYEGDTGRFHFIKSQWETFVKKHSITMKAPARGPLLMGGFRFDSKASKQEEWQHFPSAALVLPQFLLTIDCEGCWLTINAVVGPDEENIYQRIIDLEEQRERLLQRKAHSLQSASALKAYDIKGEEWKEAVACAIDEMAQGPLQKIVLSRSILAQSSNGYDIPSVIQKLTEQQPNSYVFTIERQGDTFIGATPERLVKREENKFFADALAGTAGRGKTAYEDEQLGHALLNDKKNLREHAYVVQMLKDVFAEWCESTEVDPYPTLLKTKDVQHLYTPIKGEAKSSAHLFDAVEKLHPTPAMGGTPRRLAVERITELETHDRGWYSAPIGWVDGEGNGDFSVAIRSGLISGHDARLYAGCGIVSDSHPDSEYIETEMKFRPMLNALRGSR